MSPIAPASTAAYHSAMPNFKAGKLPLPFKKDDSQTKKDKKHIPWGKIAIGAAITAGFIEFVIRRNPTRKMQQKGYAEVFAQNADHKPRDFMMFPPRDEMLIKEAASGNREAERLFGTITPEAPHVVEYINIQKKIARAEKYYIQGRFDHFQTEHETTAQIQAKFFANLDRLKKKAATLYSEHIQPFVKF